MKFRNISLIGFMGSGKSTIGKILSKKINFIFIDIDKIIEWITEKSINEIFSLYGEEYFRNLEKKVISKVYLNKSCVFACGGGVVKRGENINIIKKNSIVIYLYVSPLIAYSRLDKVKDRPLLEGKDRYEIVKEMIEDRKNLYQKCADLIIDTDRKKPNAVVDEITKRLNI